MTIIYDIRTIKAHTQGGRTNGWSDSDHERAMLDEAGSDGWILSAIKLGFNGESTKYYFYMVE